MQCDVSILILVLNWFNFSLYWGFCCLFSICQCTCTSSSSPLTMIDWWWWWLYNNPTSATGGLETELPLGEKKNCFVILLVTLHDCICVSSSLYCFVCVRTCSHSVTDVRKTKEEEEEEHSWPSSGSETTFRSRSWRSWCGAVHS